MFPSPPMTLRALWTLLQEQDRSCRSGADLTLGICDKMKEAGIDCFGPDAIGAACRSSKSLRQDAVVAAGVPCSGLQGPIWTRRFRICAAKRRPVKSRPLTAWLPAQGAL